MFQFHLWRFGIREKMTGSLHLDARKLFSGREIERNIVCHANRTALEVSIHQLDLQGLGLFVAANLHCASLSPSPAYHLKKFSGGMRPARSTPKSRSEVHPDPCRWAAARKHRSPKDTSLCT